jgi:hypothetical protein
MAKIQYLYDKGNDHYCICPTETIAVSVSQIIDKINITPHQIQYKYENGQVFEVSEQV